MGNLDVFARLVGEILLSSPVSYIDPQPPGAEMGRTVRSLEAFVSQQQPGAQMPSPSDWENDFLGGDAPLRRCEKGRRAMQAAGVWE